MNNLAQEITKRLRDGQSRGEQVVSADAPGVSVSVDIENSERYASGVRGIVVRPQQPVDSIPEVAERIIERVQELEEPLTIVEYEQGEQRAVVRSSDPEQDGSGVTYWEADVQPDRTTLHRYRKDHADPDRHVTTEPLLHRAVGRIAEQLVDAVCPEKS
jgi:hypothetical protein